MSIERRAKVAALAARGLSDPAIAVELGVSARTVLRDRRAAGIPSRYYDLLPPLPHGLSRYSSGCRCDVCRAASAAAQREYMHRTGRVKSSYAPCPTCGKRVRTVNGRVLGNSQGYAHICRVDALASQRAAS